MKLIIHIGGASVGMCHIRKNLALNESILKDNKILWPQTGRNGWVHNEYATDLSLLKELHQEAKEADANMVIISSDYFSRSTPEVNYEEFYQYFDDIQIVLYLRKQYLLVENILAWNMEKPPRNHQACFNLNEYIENIPDWYDYTLSVNLFKNIFGKNNIYIRPVSSSEYLQEEINETRLFNDFIRICGLSHIPFRIEDIAKITTSQTTLAIFENINKYDTSILGNPGYIRRFLIKHAYKFSINTPHFILSYDERLALMEKYNEGNKQIAQDFFGRDNLFPQELSPSHASMINSEDYLTTEKLIKELFLPMLQDIKEHILQTLLTNNLENQKKLDAFDISYESFLSLWKEDYGEKIIPSGVLLQQIIAPFLSDIKEYMYWEQHKNDNENFLKKQLIWRIKNVNFHSIKKEFKYLVSLWKEREATPSMYKICKRRIASEEGTNTKNRLIYISILLENKQYLKAEQALKSYMKDFSFLDIERFPYVALFAKNLGITNEEIDKSCFVYYELKKNRENQLLKQLIKGKKIAIVGNSPCEVGLNKGAQIDNHDIVIRFNNYQTEGYEADYGSRTDIWARGSGGDDVIHRTEEYQLRCWESDYKHFWYHHNHLDLLYTDLKNNVPTINFSYQTHKEIKELSGIAFPTTGLVCIYAVSKIKKELRENLSTIKLFGFSSPSQSDKTNVFCNHYFNDRDDKESQRRTEVHDLYEEHLFRNKLLKRHSSFFPFSFSKLKNMLSQEFYRTR